MPGPLQNLLINIGAKTSDAEKGFNRVERQGKKMGRSLRDEVANPINEAFKTVTGNVRSFLFGLIAVEKIIETIKRLVDRGRSTQEIANRFRISTQQAALINRTASITGLSADEIAGKIGLEEKPLTAREVRALVTAVAQQNPFSVAAEAGLAKTTTKGEILARRGAELAAGEALKPGERPTPITLPSRVARVARRIFSGPQPASNTASNVASDAQFLVGQGQNNQVLKELKEINTNTAIQARATKQPLSF